MIDITKYLSIVSKHAQNVVCTHEPIIQSYFHDNSQLELSTLRRYSYVLSWFFAYLESHSLYLNEITVMVVNDYYNHRLRQCKRKTLNNEFTILFSFLKYLYLKGILPEREYRDLEIQRPRYPKARGDEMDESLTDQEIVLILRSCKDPRTRMICWVLYHYALRPSELSRLQENDVDLQNRQVIIRESKHHRTRYIPIPPSHVDHWEKWFRQKALLFPGSDFIIPNKKYPSQSLSVQNIQYSIRKLGRSLGIRLYPYRFRRTAATMADDKGVPTSTLSKILGHADISTTSRYIQKKRKKVESDWLNYKDSEETE